MQNKDIYVTLQARDQDFLTKVFFHLDTGIQIHLMSCKVYKDRYNVDDKCLDFKRDQHNILAYRFMVSLPECLISKREAKRKAEPNQEYQWGAPASNYDNGESRVIKKKQDSLVETETWWDPWQDFPSFYEGLPKGWWLEYLHEIPHQRNLHIQLWSCLWSLQWNIDHIQQAHAESKSRWETKQDNRD